MRKNGWRRRISDRRFICINTAVRKENIMSKELKEVGKRGSGELSGRIRRSRMRDVVSHTQGLRFLSQEEWQAI